MKLYEIFDQPQSTILFETRVANENEIKEWLRGAGSHIEQKPNSYKFFTDQIYKILAKDKSTHILPYPNQDYKTEYDAKDAKAGTLVRLYLSRSNKAIITHILDWLRDAPDQTNLRGVQSLGIANQMADAYFAKKNRVATDNEDLQGIKPVFRDGEYLWVQVLSQQSLNREGKLMQHCVGSYYEKVKNEDCQIYSLRDKNNQPHCTIEVQGIMVDQIKGKQNRRVIEKYWDTCKNFINHMKFRLSNTGDAKNIGLIEIKGKWISSDEFQQMDDLSIGGNLDLYGCTALTQLPDNLSVKGDLNLSDCTALTQLPDNLSVGNYLILSGCSKLTRLSDNLSVGGGLDLTGCSKLTRLPANLSVGGALYLNKCTALTQLPKNLSVGRDLYLYGCNDITQLPKNMKIGDKIHDFSGNTAEYPQYKFR